MNRPGIRNRTLAIATGLTLLAFGAGWAMAASFVVTSGPSELGNGNYQATNNLVYWTQASVGFSSIPTTVPAALSATMASPTVLAATGQAYMINTGTAGNLNHFFKFTEATTATASTEIEIVFTVSTATVPVITTVTVFIQTQVSIPGTAQTFTLDYDLGSAAAGSITVNSVQQLSQVCSAVGTCP